MGLHYVSALRERICSNDPLFHELFFFLSVAAVREWLNESLEALYLLTLNTDIAFMMDVDLAFGDAKGQWEFERFNCFSERNRALKNNIHDIWSVEHVLLLKKLQAKILKKIYIN